MIALLVGCGDGGGTDDIVLAGGAMARAPETAGEPEETSVAFGAANAVEPDPRLRTGTFVDSAVSGLGYATETRSGTTDERGRFEYLAGESVTFSIGDLVFPSVKAAERLTPVDLGRETRDAERFAVNMARLLQTLDADGAPDNGIEIPATAAAAAAPIEFDVEPEAFEYDPAVAALLEGTPGVHGWLVSEAEATAHLAQALSVASVPDVTAELAGLWEVGHADGGGSLRYANLSADGELSLYRSGFDPFLHAPSGCLEVEHRTLTSLGGGGYFAADAAGRGNIARMEIFRSPSNGLILERGGSTDEPGRTYSMTEVSDRTPADLTLCTGESSQTPPATMDRHTDVAGLWAVDAAETRTEGDRPLSRVHLDEYGYGRLFVREKEFGPAPLFELVDCHAPAGELYLFGTDGNGSLLGDAGFEEQVIERHDDVVYEYAGYVNRAVSLTREGEALLFDVEGESRRRLSIVEGGVESLPTCGQLDSSPLTAIDGLWRERGAGLFGDYVHIDVDGTVRGISPAPDGDACYLDVPDVSLSPIGGLDFQSVRDDGTTRTLRMSVVGSMLTLSEVAADGSAVPVRWLEKARGLVLDDFERCGTRPEATTFTELEPFVGTWLQLGLEETNDWGPNGEDVVYRQYHFMEISATGARRQAFASVGDYYSYRMDELCGYEGWTPDSAIEVIGDGLFRMDGKVTTISREADALTITGLSPRPRVLQRSDIDVSALPSCGSGLSPVDPLLGPLDGVWLLEAPTDTDPSFTLLRLDSERRDGRDHFIYRFDALADCHVRKALVAESVDGERVVLSHRDEGGNAVGVFGIVDGELDIALRSGSDELQGVRDGRYPGVPGLDVERLLSDGQPFRHDRAGTPSGVCRP